VTDTQQPKLEPEVHQEDQGGKGVARFCERMLACMRMDLGVESSAGEAGIFVNLSGPDRPLLLSNTAAVLNSLEYLANKAFRTGQGAKISNISFDSDHYRQHRESELTLLAEMAAKKVLTQRKPLTLQPMTPRERRIVHLALAEVGGVRSQSDGEGDHRSITIYPADK
jgi:spoIIIJ-associated protein